MCYWIIIILTFDESLFLYNIIISSAITMIILWSRVAGSYEEITTPSAKNNEQLRSYPHSVDRMQSDSRQSTPPYVHSISA